MIFVAIVARAPTVAFMCHMGHPHRRQQPIHRAVSDGTDGRESAEVPRIHHTALKTRDIRRAMKFYSLLGFTVGNPLFRVALASPSQDPRLSLSAERAIPYRSSAGSVARATV